MRHSGVKMLSRIAVALAVLLAIGYFSLSWGAWADGNAQIVWGLRFPRLLNAIAVGSGLSLAGVILQALFSNPLCEPYTLGVSSGAAVGVVLFQSLAVQLGISSVFFGFSIGGLVGSIVFTLILLLFGMRKQTNQTSFLLGGVILGMLGSSVLSVWMAMTDPNGVQAALSWMLGDLQKGSIESATVTGLVVFFVFAVIVLKSRVLDALLLGELEASSLAIAVKKERVLFLFLAALLVSVCVSSAGMIGFIGLLVPHGVRLRVGASHSRVSILATLWGAVCLSLADLVSQRLFQTRELPVGAVTALVGAPVLMIWLLKRNVRGIR